MRCEICDEPMERTTFAEAGADFWLGEVPADDDPVYVCAGCGDIVPLG